MSSDYLQDIVLLSIWELAHRWMGFNPDNTDPDKLPESFSDKIREILSATGSYLNLYDETGKEELETWIPIINLTLSNKAKQLANSYLLKRHYPKDDLDSFFVYRDEVKKWRLSNNLTLPEFWFSENEIEDFDGERKQIFSFHPEIKPIKTRTSQNTKLKCQQLAQQLWKENPEINITGMAIHAKIIDICTTSKKTYTEKTRREWVQKIAPLRLKGKSGRPKKTT